ncbi:MAG TPA: hypothetical protein VHC63_10110 [Acidimicrobiales bacterium]|nr:hypothetical protein [Acidimicrobiales bacterium]
MRGRLGVACVVLAALTAACGMPTFTAKDASAHKLPRTQPKTEIGDAAVLDRTSTTTVPVTGRAPTTTALTAAYPPGVSHRVVAGVDLVLQTNETATFRGGTAVHLVLSITNRTGRSIGYLTNRESHFALLDSSDRPLWSDQTCRSADVYTTVPTGFLEITPGDHVAIDDYYPTHPGTPTTGCTAPSGRARLVAGVTICLNLAPDWTCRGASDQRIEAAPIDVTVA